MGTPSYRVTFADITEFCDLARDWKVTELPVRYIWQIYGCVSGGLPKMMRHIFTPLMRK